MNQKPASLSEAAEEWCRSVGREVPKRNTPEWLEMYDNWVDHTFITEDDESVLLAR